MRRALRTVKVMDRDDKESLEVSALKWMADTGKLEQLQHQCASYTSEAERVSKKF